MKRKKKRKGNHWQNEKTSTEWKKIFANDMTNKGLIFKIYEQLILLNTEKTKQIIWLKNGKKTWKGIYSKKNKDGQWAHVKHNIVNHQRNVKQSYNMTSYLSEWLLSKRPQTTNVGKNVEKREPSYTVGGNINWCSHCGKQYGSFSKNWRYNYHMTQ